MAELVGGLPALTRAPLAEFRIRKTHYQGLFTANGTSNFQLGGVYPLAYSARYARSGRVRAHAFRLAFLFPSSDLYALARP